MQEYELVACFSRVIKARHWWTEVRQKLGVGKWKKNGVLAFQNVPKTGNIGKKSPVVGDIDYVRYLSMQKAYDRSICL